MKKNFLRGLSLSMITFLLVNCFSVGLVVARTGNEDSLYPVVATIDPNAKTVTIGNGFIERNLTFADNKVATTSISNKRSGITLTPGIGSEDFILDVNNAFISDANPVAARLITASDLTLTGTPKVTTADGMTIVAFLFEPFVKNDVPWTVTYSIVMKDGDNFMNSYLEIGVPEENYENAYIISIDLDAFNIGRPDDSLLFCRPETIIRQYLSDYMTGFGQPLYVNSLFFGVEFPVIDNRIVPFPKAANADLDKTLVMRYYSGKNFTRMKTEGKLETGKFVTWPAVVGAARTNDYEVVQADFFDYIHGIAQGASFSTQYNTWYDGRRYITPQSVTESFMGIEQGLTQAGLPPIDSYVVDDGYPDYSAPWWEFKQAFANDAMLEVSEMMTAAGGAYGLWTSPRGGYANDQWPFMQAAGTGFGASVGKICVGAPVYQELFEQHMCNWQDEFNINYWKIDGLAAQPCTTTTHGHMVGGTAGGQTAANSSVYFYVELWENWTQLFANAKAHGARGNPVFYNCTSYCVPSPWFLEYVNTVYLQTSSDSGKAGPTTGDVGEVGDGARRLTYRDDQYWRFFVNNKFQIPYNYIWNHDPIYALGDNYVVMTDQDLRENLYGNAMRGVAIWEMLYSQSMITEGQWMATKEALDFSKDYEYILKYSRLIAPNGQIASGNNEAQVNGYMYSAWVEDEGFVSFRNPKASTPITLTLTLDRISGVKESMKDLSMTYVLPSAIDSGNVQNRKETYSYGDTITVTLEPQGFVIVHFGPKDISAPEILRTEVLDDNTLRVFFNEAIELSDAPITVANHTVSGAVLTQDFKAVDITVSDAFTDNESLALTSLTAKDLSANQATVSANARYAAGRLISQFNAAADLTAAAAVSDDALLQSAVLSLDGDTVGFAGSASADLTNKLSVSSMVKTEGSGKLFEQADAYSVKINAAGKVEFTVGDLTVQSKQVVNDGTWHHFVCVKEPNELLKIYIDGKISASAYDGPEQVMLGAGAVTIGSANFAGELSQIKVYNKSLGYKEVAALAAQPLFTYELAGVNAFTVAGLEPQLPGSMQARYDTTNYFRNYDATWDDVDAGDYAAPGAVSITGRLPGFDGTAVSGTLSVLDAWPANASLKAADLASLDLSDWEILNQNDSRLSVNASGLMITAQPGKMDRGNIDPATQEILPDVVNENFFLTDPDLKDYCVTVGVNGRADQLNKSAGLIFRQDDDNFVRMTYKISGTGPNASFSLNVKEGTRNYTLEAPPPANLNPYYLALDKKGDYYTGYYSSDGAIWTKLGTVKAQLDNPKSGFYATLGIQNVPGFTSTTFQPRFSDFTIRQYSVGLTYAADTAAELNLPSNAQVPRYTWADTTFSDGSKGALLVQLPAIDPELLENPGTFTVKGTVAGEVTQVDVNVVVGEPVEQIDVTLGVDTIVETYAANIPVSVDPKFDGAIVTFEGAEESAVIKDGKATFRLSKASEPGVYRIKVSLGDSAEGYADITVASAAGLWTPTILSSPSGLKITFAGIISGVITTDKGPAVIGADGQTLTVSFDNTEAGIIVIRKVKYPKLFPSYSFTFTMAYEEPTLS